MRPTQTHRLLPSEVKSVASAVAAIQDAHANSDTHRRILDRTTVVENQFLDFVQRWF